MGDPGDIRGQGTGFVDLVVNFKPGMEGWIAFALS